MYVAVLGYWVDRAQVSITDRIDVCVSERGLIIIMILRQARSASKSVESINQYLGYLNGLNFNIALSSPSICLFALCVSSRSQHHRYVHLRSVIHHPLKKQWQVHRRSCELNK